MPDWHDICALEELEEGVPRLVEVASQTVGIRLWRGRVFAMINRCGHAGAPIALGEIFPVMRSEGPGEPVEVDVEHPEIRCPWHHWGFDLSTGECTARVRRPRLRIYQTRIEDGRVSVLA